MKKFAILAGLMALALFVGVTGSAFRAGKAEAKPTDIIAFNPNVCILLASGLDWDANLLTADTNADGIADLAVDLTGDGVVNGADNAAYVCSPSIAGPIVHEGLTNPANLAALAAALGGDVDDAATYQDLVDASAAQLGQTSAAGQTLWVLTFVGNDQSLTLNADEGVWLSSGTSTSVCPFGDEDCDADVPAVIGDGVVVDMLIGNAITDSHRGDAEAVATAAGVDVTLDYTVVGVPDDITLTASKSTIQEDSGSACDVSKFTDEIKNPDVAGLIANVVDEDGTSLTGIWVDWTSKDTDAVDLSTDSIVSIAQGDVVAAFNLGCGDSVGSSKITAEVDADDSIDAETTITVVGAPASITLAAAPAAIMCDGTATSTVTATVKDSAGNPVVAGNQVRFDVVALGVVTPIVATTDAKGVATTTLTPLSGTAQGVTVIATVLETNDSVVYNTTIEGNIRVDCQALPTVAPPVPPVVVPAVTPNITGPNTGDGGYLP
jgi:hypothetical protein